MSRQPIARMVVAPAAPRSTVAALAGLLLVGLLTACGPASPPSAFPSASPSSHPTPTPTVSPSPTSPSPTSPSPTTPTTTAPTTTTTTSKPPTSKPPTSKPPTPPPFPNWLRGEDLTRIPTSSKVIALTFDAGANANGVASILATLDAKDVVGTFFLTGDFVEQFPGPSQQIAAAGHRLGNHTVNHPHLPTLSDAQVRAEVLNAKASIVDVTGKNPAPWFRFPYGDRNARVIGLVNDLGYAAIRWTVDSLGWQGTMGGTRTATYVRDRVLNAATPGGIVLMHVGSHPSDHSTFDADALPAIIDGLRAQGYSFVTLDYLLTLP